MHKPLAQILLKMAPMCCAARQRAGVEQKGLEHSVFLENIHELEVLSGGERLQKVHDQYGRCMLPMMQFDFLGYTQPEKEVSQPETFSEIIFENHVSISTRKFPIMISYLNSELSTQGIRKTQTSNTLRPTPPSTKEGRN